jgi:hypothetical protein
MIRDSTVARELAWTTIDGEVDLEEAEAVRGFRFPSAGGRRPRRRRTADQWLPAASADEG